MLWFLLYFIPFHAAVPVAPFTNVSTSSILMEFGCRIRPPFLRMSCEQDKNLLTAHSQVMAGDHTAYG